MNDVVITSEHEMADLRRRLEEMDRLKRRCADVEDALKTLEQRNRQLGDSAPLGIVAIDRQGGVQGINRKLRDWLPWPQDQDPVGTNLFEFQPLQEAGVIDHFRLCIAQNRTILSDYSCIDNGGRCLQLRFHLGPVTDEHGSVTGALAFVENTTPLKEAQAAAQENEQRYHLLFQSAPIAMVERDASRLKMYLDELQASGVEDLKDYFQRNPQEVERCVAMIRTADCNRAFLELLETDDKESLLADLPRVMMGPAFLTMAQEMLLLVVQGCFIPEREMTIRTVQGRSKRVILRAMALAGHETTMARVVLTLVDISARVEAEEALRANERRFRDQALQDNLTGLYNQRYLHHSLPLLIQTAKAEHSPLSVIFIDLDNFKRVVDTHGHLNGSRTIQEVAAVIRHGIQSPAYAVAYAGDEFVIVLPDADGAQAMTKASQIQKLIKDTVYLRSQGRNVRLEASFGIAAYPQHGGDAEALLAAADAALFEIKGSGKGAIGRYADSRSG